MISHQVLKFAILFQPRTGSHLLRTSLDSHPSIHKVESEFFSNNRIREGEPLFRDQHSDKTEGVKLSTQALLETGRLEEVDCPKIVTYRHNKLSQYISMKLATKEDNWLGKPYSSSSKIKINVWKTGCYIETLIRNEEIIRQTFDDCLWVEYGEICSGKAFPKICRFLGLPDVKLTSYLKKQSSGRNCDYIENLDYVKASNLMGWL